MDLLDNLDSISLARQMLEIVEDKQASNIVLLDVHEMTTLTRYFLISPVDALRDATAHYDELLEKLRPHLNLIELRLEGVETVLGR